MVFVLFLMRLTIHNPKDNSWTALRKAGYVPQGQSQGQQGYVRSLFGSGYPRFHIYVERERPGEELVFTLHLDQKKPSYEGSHAHSGDYDGEVVQKESERVKEIFSSEV